MRGRDIKRYSYEFADLYLIATFPSLKTDIEQYPAVKQHLMSFGYNRLKQTGDKGSRKKTNNQWFETQDSISYWEDFYKQKIVWKRIGSILRFAYDDGGILSLDSTCFATGKYIKYLVAILNSNFGNYIMKDSPKTGTGDLLISVQAIEPLFIPKPSQSELELLENHIDEILHLQKGNEETLDIEKQINYLIYNKLSLSEDEINFIETQCN